jgi:hypothetical protein
MIDIAAEVSVALAPVLAELAAVRFELAQVRASLPPRMISLADAAEALACDPQTVRAMCDRHELVWRRCGRRIVVDAASLRPVDRATVAALADAARAGR